MTNNVKLTDWAEYFDSVPSSTLVNKGCMENLFKTFDSSISSDEAIAQFEKHTYTVFLVRLSLCSGLNVFHHLIQVGGTVYSNEKKSGFILDSNKITSAITTPYIDILFRTPDAQAYKVAKLEDILKCVSIEGIQILKDNTSESYQARNFIPIPPFLMHLIHSAISVYQGNTEKILLNAISSIK